MSPARPEHGAKGKNYAVGFRVCYPGKVKRQCTFKNPLCPVFRAEWKKENGGRPCSNYSSDYGQQLLQLSEQKGKARKSFKQLPYIT